MASLLYVSARPETAAADAEFASFRRALGVPDLDRLDLLAESLSDEMLTGYRGIVIGGSPFNVTDAEKSEAQLRLEADLQRIAALAIAEKVAVFFTCFGIGVVTRMLGGTVTLAHPEEVSAAKIQLTDAAAADPIFGPAGATVTALTAHKEGTATVPQGAVLLGTNAACPVQAYRVGTHLYATQFHPEPTPRDFADRMVFYRTTGYFDPTEFDAVQRQILAQDVQSGADLLRRFAERFAS